jgi:tetratricopeptide (TPR) repeat protein
MCKQELSFLAFVVMISFVIGLCNAEDLQMKENKISSSILRYKKDLALNPNDADLHYSLGLQLYASGDNENAIKELRRAKELYINQGNIEAALRVEEAINSLTPSETVKELQNKIDEVAKKVGEIRHILQVNGLMPGEETEKDK